MLLFVTESFCKDTTNILISQEKMGDNIKKVAILFVISDFCSIYYCNNDKKASLFAGEGWLSWSLHGKIIRIIL